MNPLATQIITLIRLYPFDLSSEKRTQADLERLLQTKGLPYRREVNLGGGDIIDFMVDDVGIEVKLKADKKAIYRQIVRYARHDAVATLILATNTSMGLPQQIRTKNIYCVSLAEGWL